MIDFLESGVNLALCNLLLMSVIINAYQLLQNRRLSVELDALRSERDHWIAQAPLDPDWTLGEPVAAIGGYGDDASGD